MGPISIKTENLRHYKEMGYVTDSISTPAAFAMVVKRQLLPTVPGIT